MGFLAILKKGEKVRTGILIDRNELPKLKFYDNDSIVVKRFTKKSDFFKGTLIINDNDFKGAFKDNTFSSIDRVEDIDKKLLSDVFKDFYKKTFPIEDRINNRELNIILKGDVDGSVEALTDSFQKLSTAEIQVNIIHKGVGAITESDVLLASASDAIIVGFNVRPSGNARILADNEEIDVRMYSIIYDAINDLRDAMEGMLSPELKEEITGNVDIREVYKISKVGNIAGCMVTSGKIFRNSKIRIIRDSVVIHSGELTSLKRFKDDAKEVAKGYDCGIQIKNYNDIEVGDVIEAYQEVEVKKKLKR